MNATSLLIRCREGDPAALDEFARRCQPVIERLALTLLEDGRQNPLPDVRAAVQETLLAAFSAPETFKDEEGFNTWLFSLGLRSCRQRMQPRMAGNREANVLPVTGPGAGSRQGLQAAVQALELELRLPLLLHYANGLTVAQTAQVLKLGQNTVVARLVTGRGALNNSASRVDFEHQMAREWIYRRLDGGLSAENRLHLDQHLERCAECRAYEAQVRHLDRRLRTELPALGAARQADGPVTPPLGEWLGQQLQMRQQGQSRLRRAGMVGLVLAGLIMLAAYFAQPENRAPLDAPSFSDLGSTQTAGAAVPTATRAATQTPRASLLPRPEGRLLYEASDNRSTDLYFTAADASGRRLLAPNPSSDRAPHPSPDRRWVAFLSNRANDRQYDIYLTDVEGSATQRLTDIGAGFIDAVTHRAGSYGADTNGGARNSTALMSWTGEMAWSPDSRYLVAVMDNPDPAVPFVVERGDRVDESRHYEGQWEGRLYRIDVQTGQVMALTPPDLLVWNPAWSPDGERVYFNALMNGYTRLLSVMADGSDQRILGDIEGTGEQSGFSFSPDGKTLAYLVLRRTRGTNFPDALFLYDMVSGRNRALQAISNTADIDLPLAARFSTVRWSPDGLRLVYAIPNADGQAVLRMLEVQPDPDLPWVLRPGVETILYVGIDLYFPGHTPAWSLDGRSLGILQGRRVYVISAHSDADSNGGSELMEIYAGKRDEIGAGWLSWFP